MHKSAAVSACAALLLVVSLPSPASSQSADNVAIVINEASSDSKQIAEHYIGKRRIPAKNVIRIKTTLDDTIGREQYQRSIETPIAVALRAAALQDRILFLVLTKGIPLRIAGTGGVDGTGSSVDSELTLLYRRMTGQDVPAAGRVANPYFQPQQSKANLFTRQQFDIYLVTRLDAFTVEEAMALIDRAQSPSSDGRFVLDQRALFTNPAGDLWLAVAEKRLTESGFGKRLVSDTTDKPVRNVEGVLGYYGWGSNDPQHRSRQTTMSFAPGALAVVFGSGEARTFREPPPGWTPTGNWADRSTWFEGAPEVLTGDLIREGATGVAGHVSDPFLQSSIRPDVLFPAYAGGLTLAEAFYAAMPHLSWQTVVVGDPLCTPFPRPASAANGEEPLDPETELPGVFAKRRLARLRTTMKGATPELLSAVLLAEARLDRSDRPGAIRALEQITEMVPENVRAHFQLASLHEQEKQFSQARDRYERILKLEPNNAVVLNNLAYHIAVRENDPARAKPFAEKATSLSTNPTIADTLAWIEYLLGNYTTAARLITTAVKGVPQNAEIRFHAAAIFAATNDLKAANDQLKAALELDPALRERAEVQELERRLLKPDA